MQRYRGSRQKMPSDHPLVPSPLAAGHHRGNRLLRPAQTSRSGCDRRGGNSGRQRPQGAPRRIHRAMGGRTPRARGGSADAAAARVHTLVCARRPHTLLSEGAGRLRLLVYLLHHSRRARTLAQRHNRFSRCPGRAGRTRGSPGDCNHRREHRRLRPANRRRRR